MQTPMTKITMEFPTLRDRLRVYWWLLLNAWQNGRWWPTEADKFDLLFMIKLLSERGHGSLDIVETGEKPKVVDDARKNWN